jgi:hypothetical protein
MTKIVQSNTLYEQDFNLWLEDLLTHLKARDVRHLDWENLIEEIEALGRSEKRGSIHRLEVLLAHLLKRIYLDSAYDNRGWELTIREQRRQLQLQLKQSPSLKKYLSEAFDECFEYALSQVRQEYAKVSFPGRWEYSQDLDALLSEDFWTS